MTFPQTTALTAKPAGWRTFTLTRDRTRFATLNIVGLITKPFNPLSLPQQIATLLNWSL